MSDVRTTLRGTLRTTVCTTLGAAVLALVSLAFLAGCGRDPAREPGATTSLIGLDGADWRNALPLMRQGKLPTLAALKRSGTSGVMLTNPDYRWSPVLWTTIATGKLPDKHGVTSFMAPLPGTGTRIPTPSTARQCRALWNIFSERHATVGFVGWWVTWPAEPVNGFMVTDHFSVSRFDLEKDYAKDNVEAQRPEKETYPEDLAREIDSLKVSRDDVDVNDLAHFADLPAGFQFPTQFEKFEKISEFAIAHSVDRTHFGAGRKLLAERRPELFGVFFQGVDILQHFFWEFMDPEGPGTKPAASERAIFGQSIERYYAFADSLVGAMIDAGGDERATLIVSDHGFRPGTERYADKNISGEHRRQAFFVFAGPNVVRGGSVGDVDAVDVTPTILAYHGFPVADDMDGDVVTECFEPEWLAQHPIEFIETYEIGEWDRGELPEASSAKELEERIRTLGYIE
jgi:predicted AlkP superfamily phosphohydrolase/phosphomutase